MLVRVVCLSHCYGQALVQCPGASWVTHGMHAYRDAFDWEQTASIWNASKRNRDTFDWEAECIPRVMRARLEQGWIHGTRLKRHQTAIPCDVTGVFGRKRTKASRILSTNHDLDGIRSQPHPTSAHIISAPALLAPPPATLIFILSPQGLKCKKKKKG